MAFLNPAYMADQDAKYQAYRAEADTFGTAYFAAEQADAAVTSAQNRLAAITKAVATLSNPDDGLALIEIAEQAVKDAQTAASNAHAAANALHDPFVQSELTVLATFGTLAGMNPLPGPSTGADITQPPILPQPNTGPVPAQANA